jgi:hypothetical protein
MESFCKELSAWVFSLSFLSDLAAIIGIDSASIEQIVAAFQETT